MENVREFFQNIVLQFPLIRSNAYHHFQHYQNNMPGFSLQLLQNISQDQNNPILSIARIQYDIYF